MNRTSQFAIFFQCVLCATGIADDRVSFENVLSTAQVSDPSRLLELIERSHFDCSSSPGDRHAYFEHTWTMAALIRDGFGNPIPLLDVRVDDNGRRCALLMPANQANPARLMLGGEWLMVDNTRWELRNIESWSYQLDGEHLQSPTDPRRRPAGYRQPGFAKVDPGSILERCFQFEKPHTEWHPACRTLTAEKSNGTVAWVQFRTPNDQQRFGTVLSMLYVRGRDGAEYVCNSVIVDRESPLRINIRNEDELAERLSAVKTSVPHEWAVVPLVASESERRVAHLLENEIRFESMALNHVTFRDRRLTFDECVALFMQVEKHDLLPAIKAGRQFAEHRDFTDLVVAFLEAACQTIEIQAASRDSIAGSALLDDPHLMNLGLERAVTTRGSFLVSELCRRLLTERVLPYRDRVKLAAAFGELGPPVPSTLWFQESGPNEELMFLRLILEARWSQPERSEALALCAEVLGDPSAPDWKRNASIDSLVRWGKLSEIPPNQKDEWMRSAMRASSAFRHCTWKALTRTTAGRQYVYGCWKTVLADDRDARNEILGMLRQRASATLEMRRFDFMSAAECHDILLSDKPTFAVSNGPAKN